MKAVIYEAFGAPPQLTNVLIQRRKHMGSWRREFAAGISMAEKAKKIVATGSEIYSEVSRWK